MATDRIESRVQALADVAHRYGAIIANLLLAAEDVVYDLEGERRERLCSAILDTNAQLAAAGSALDRALADLAEGAE